jgi:hypothetical protein
MTLVIKEEFLVLIDVSWKLLIHDYMYSSFMRSYCTLNECLNGDIPIHALYCTALYCTVAY